MYTHFGFGGALGLPLAILWGPFGFLWLSLGCPFGSHFQPPGSPWMLQEPLQMFLKNARQTVQNTLQQQ